MATGTISPGDPAARTGQAIWQMERLVYIASCWHSGSTLLDMLLGSNAGVTSLGEVGKLSHILRGTWGRVRCSCGSVLGECPFWTEVRERLRGRLGAPELALENFHVSHLVEHESIHRYVPRLPELLLLLGNRPLWRSAGHISAATAGHHQAARNAYAMFDEIAVMNRTPVIVDSSKEPAQLKSLFLADPARFRVVHLVRDGRAVTLSLMKDQGLTLEEAARKWVRFNRNLKAVLFTIPRRHVRLVRYEDICAGPAAAIRPIATFCGIELTIDLERPQLAKDRYHIVGGNPMRLRRQETTIRLDEKWKAAFSAAEVARIERILGRMNRSFGYR